MPGCCFTLIVPKSGSCAIVFRLLSQCFREIPDHIAHEMAVLNYSAFLCSSCGFGVMKAFSYGERFSMLFIYDHDDIAFAECALNPHDAWSHDISAFANVGYGAHVNHDFRYLSAKFIKE